MNTKIFFVVGLMVLVLIAAAFGGWYFYISKKQSEVTNESTFRGLGASIPSFDGIGGSLRGNMEETFTEGELVTKDIATSTTESLPPPKLWRVSKVPTAGVYVVAQKKTATAFFVDRATGNIFRTSPGKEPVRVTNTLIPYVQDVEWFDEKTLVLRHPDESGLGLLYFAAVISYPTTTPGSASSSSVATLQGSYLPKETISVATNPAKKSPQLLYLVREKSGSSIGVTSDIKLKNPQRVWASSLSGWVLSWVSEKQVVFRQKSAEGISGSSYSLSLPEKVLSSLIGNKDGLSVSASQSGDSFLYSTAINGKVQLYLKNTTSDHVLDITTFADKCVWGNGDTAYCAVPDALPETSLPDAWYRGEVHTNDRWFSINGRDGSVSEIVSPESDFGTSIDVVRPKMDPTGQYIIFTDAVQGTGWVLTI
ncbi:MAG: hypothetical protein AAB421_03760 [Patescibacteria group bacterium]